MRSDEGNLLLVDTLESVDDINSRFYGRFPYPWRPMAFDKVTDPYFETLMLNQSIGSWDHSIIPPQPRILVAGCGTNQAVFTALRFPQAEVKGIDLSISSLEACADTARQLGVSNLEVRRQSINEIAYQNEFDYIICTGVIHHNADPSAPLKRLVTALKPAGILELMVYNRYHRMETTAFQKAVRLLGQAVREINYERELQVAKKIINGIKCDNRMTRFLATRKDLPEPALADSLLQPVEYSFTVESLEALTTSCGLELVAPCINQFDKAQGTFSWNLEFDDPELQDLYDSLPDTQRWQISNLLMHEKSPMLWFYLQRSDAGRGRKSEQRLCEEFLNQRFIKSRTEKMTYVRGDDGRYEALARLRTYPITHPDPECRKVLEAIEVQASSLMKDVLERLGVRESFQAVNRLRLLLSTNGFPYLVSSSSSSRRR